MKGEKNSNGYGKEFKIPEDVIDVMAQTKWPVENTFYFEANVKRFKEMAKAPKEKKNINTFGLN